MKTGIFAFLFFILFSLDLGAKDVEATGTGQGSTKLESENQAKISALDSAFKQLGKDSLYLNLYKQNSLQYSQTKFKDSKTEPSGEGFKTTVTVVIDPFNLDLVNSQYEEAVTFILNDTEKEIKAVENLLNEGKKALDAMRYQDALKNYREAKSRSESQIAALGKFSDPSIRSQAGNPKAVLEQSLKTRLDRAADGLTRLESIEKQGRDELALRDLSLAFTQWEVKQADISKYSRKIATFMPFYDWAKGDLEKTLSEVSIQFKSQSEIKTEMERISSKVPESNVLFKSRIRLTITSGEENLKTLQDAIRALDLEIKDPRMERIERDRQAKIFWKEVGEFFLVKPSKENFALRLNLPFSFSHNPLAFHWPGFDFLQLKLEGWANNFWGRSALRFESQSLSGGTTLYSINQDASLAIGSDLFIGGGLAWDWAQWASQNDQNYNIGPGLKILAHVGHIDEKNQWPAWQLTGAFRIPAVLGQFPSFKVDGLVRLDTFAKAEGGFMKDEVANTSYSTLDSIYSWNLGAGLKLPSSLYWGMRFDSRGVGAQNTPLLWTYTWRLFLEYSF